MADEAGAEVKVAITASKPGVKTTEFWLTALVTVAGLVVAAGIFPSDSPWVKVAGLVVSAGAALGYTAVRGGIKKAPFSILLVVITLGMLSGCCKGHIAAEAVDGLVTKVADRHDRFVKGEATAEDKDPKNKETFLRSTELLRKVVSEAKK
jgi:1,4-dihydroxy-2-naphthoate octaprenyltransferase